MPKLSKKDQRGRVTITESRRRKEQALARLREMEADEKAGKLIDAEGVKDAWTKITGAIKAAVLRMPDKLARQLAAAADAREVRVLLAAECETILRGLSDEISGYSNSNSKTAR